MHKVITRLIIISSMAFLLSACARKEGNADNNMIATSGTSGTEINILTKAELLTDENRGLIGKAITNTEPAGSYPPDYQENTSQVENRVTIIPENSVINGTEEKVLIPNSISVFAAEDNNTPEVIMPNGSCAVFIPSAKTKGWSCQKGDVLCFTFEKYTSEVSNEQTMVIGAACNGIMLEGENFTSERGEYTFIASDQGDYAIYIISTASDYLALKEGCVTVNRDDDDSETTMDYRENKTGVEIFGVTPAKISSIEVVINSGTAKGKQYDLSMENGAVTYQKIIKMFFGENIKYAPTKTLYDSDDYALKVCFNGQNSQYDVFVYDEDTIRTDQIDDFYKISQKIDSTIFKNLVQQSQ